MASTPAAASTADPSAGPYLSEIILYSTPTLTNIQVADLATGTRIGEIKGAAAAAGHSVMAAVPHPTLPLQSSGLMVIENAKNRMRRFIWPSSVAHPDLLITNELLRVVAVSPCGQWCAGAGDAGRVHLWHLPRGKLIHFWDAHFQAIRAMAFRPDGQALATAGDDGSIVVTRLAARIDATANAADPLMAFSAQQGFTSGRDGGDADTVTLQGHSLAVTQIAWSRLPSAPRLFSTSLDRTFRIWQPATGQCLATILFPSPLTCLAVNALETIVLVGDREGHLFVKPLLQRTGPGLTDVQHLTRERLYDYTADEAAAGGADGPTGAAAADGTRTLSEHDGAILSVALSFEETRAVSASSDGTVKIWDLASAQPVSSFRALPARDGVNTAITGLVVMLRPEGLLTLGGTSGGGGAAHGQSQDAASKLPWERIPSNTGELALPIMAAHAASAAAAAPSMHGLMDQLADLEDGFDAADASSAMGVAAAPVAPLATAAAAPSSAEVAELKRQLAALKQERDAAESARAAAVAERHELAAQMDSMQSENVMLQERLLSQIESDSKAD